MTTTQETGGIRLAVLDRWLDTAQRGELLTYHRGELARDKAADPALAALADRMLEISNGDFNVVSRCGHIRGRIVGSRLVELITRRERGESVYLARKL